MAQISQELPFINKLILQTDNAKSYSNNLLLCGISLLNVMYKVKKLGVVEFIHTETQDGKTILDAFFSRCMKFVHSWIAQLEENKTKKIGTPLELGRALSHNGGMRNTILQIVTTNKDHTVKIEKKFDNVVKCFQKYFSRVNHVYFTDHTQLPEELATQMMQNITNDDKCLDIIDHLKFDIGVQAFSNLNRVVTFHVDMKKPKSRQMKPDQLVLDEIEFFMEVQQNNVHSDSVHTQVQSVNPPANINVSPSSIEVNDAVTALLDLGTSNASSKYDKAFRTQIHHNIDGINVTSDDTVNNDDSIIDDSDYDSDLPNHEDSNDEQNNNEIINKREMKIADQNLYAKSLFITRVKIDHMLSIGGLTSFDLLSHNRSQMKKGFKGDNTRQDLKSKAIRMANDHIQTGDLSILSSTKDNPLLNDSVDYDMSNSNLPNFEQGWGRRVSRNESASMYGETYIGPYQEILKKLFGEGSKNSSKKMNAAMMREALKQQFPDTFSIPGETEIKKYISQLFAKSKSYKNRGEDDLVIGDEIINCTKVNEMSNERINWTKILRKIVEELPSEKPENIYNYFMTKFEEHERSQLPTKDVVKKKISSFKANIRRRMMRSILQP